MNNEFFDALNILEQEKGINVESLLEKITVAIENAVKKDFGEPENIIIDINPETRKFNVAIRKAVVETVENPKAEITLDEALTYSKRAKIGGHVDIKIKTKDMGRIAAQSAKHVFRQGIKEEERLNTFKEYQSKVHELISAKVVGIDEARGSVTLDMGKGELMLPQTEMLPGETFNIGDSVRVYVVDVKRNLEKTSRPPKIMISRTHPGMVKRLFELEVPEIYDGTVEIKSISREAGSRTKMAVYSRDENVDAVGACIGAKSTRIDSVVAELGGEKIDIVKYSEDPVEFITAALSPAKHITKVEIIESDEEDVKACRVTVADNELSLAIGNKGQNVRLAARLTGYKIDIRPESGFYGEN
ncbi:MAG: transcription termination/antitermination protein NusA [Oscillospiraceae bacterium]|nr:transcription termination/antitermination protein NusA [Oscillospiraceae bacterium]